MITATLGIILHEGQILLGEKKKGEIGTGVLCGPGGKLDADDPTLEACLLRETLEELAIRLDPASLELAAYIIFHKGRTRFIVLNKILKFLGMRYTIPDFEVYIYRARILSGNLVETDDMIPGLYPLDNLPFEQMYEADRHWLPRITQGEKFNANVYYFDRAKAFDRIEFLPFGA